MSEERVLSPAKPYPGSPTLEPTVESLYTVVMALQEAVEILCRQRGYVVDSAATIDDLIYLGLLPQDIVSRLNDRSTRSPSG